jgi:hypothetical protein
VQDYALPQRSCLESTKSNEQANQILELRPSLSHP